MTLNHIQYKNSFFSQDMEKTDWRDHVIFTIWLTVTFKQFAHDELVLYPMALYFALVFLRDFNLIFPLIRRSLILWAFPFWCILSVLWGAETQAIIKSSLQQILTVMICYWAVLRLERHDILLSMLVACSVFAIGNLVLEPNGGAPERGIFTSKNAMGNSMAILLLVSFCVILSRTQPFLARLIGGIFIPIAIFLILMSHSATALLLAIGMISVVLFSIILLGRGPLYIWVIIISLGLTALSFFGLGLYSAANDTNLVEAILVAFDKDTTLTGRTTLWSYAAEQIKENPFLGVGEGGFWTPNDWSSLARRIHIDFDKSNYASFNFHNSFLEIAVHQGLIGLGLVLTVLFWCFFKIIASALVELSMSRVFFVAISLALVARSMTEAGYMAPFSLMTTLLFIGALYHIKDRATSYNILI